jgi:hypothetical protein
MRIDNVNFRSQWHSHLIRNPEHLVLQSILTIRSAQNSTPVS